MSKLNQKKNEKLPLGVKGIFKLLSPCGKKFIFVLIVITMLSALVPFISVWLTNVVFKLLETETAEIDYVLSVIAIIGLLLIVKLTQNLFQYIRENIEFNVQEVASETITHKQLELRYDQITDMEIREKMELAGSVIYNSRLRNALNNLISIAKSAFVFLGLSSLLLIIGNLMIIVIFVVLLLNTLYLVRVNKRERKLQFDMGDVYNKSRYYNMTSTRSNVIRENIFSANSNVYLSDYEDVRRKKMDYSVKFLRMNNKKTIISLILHYLMEVLMYIYLGYLFFVLESITVATFSAMVVAFAQIDIALKDFVNSIISLYDTTKYIEKYNDFMDVECGNEKTNVKVNFKSKNIFEFKNVSYKYKNSKKYALKDVSIKFSSDDKISVVGQNGAGKTTFVKLLLGLIEPSDGQIILNGVDIREYSKEEYFELFSTISQQFRLFPFSVLENITNEEDISKVDKEKFINMTHKAGISDKIGKLNKKENTKISREYYEDGVEFSGGEQQKIAFARALYKDAPCLVFDEPTSALDPMSEYRIYSEFNEVAKDKMVIYVTHRLSSIKFSNRVLMFENSELIGDGTHDQLIKSLDKYKKLYNAQAELYEKGCV